jgi:hypothetical protein
VYVGAGAGAAAPPPLEQQLLSAHRANVRGECRLLTLNAFVLEMRHTSYFGFFFVFRLNLMLRAIFSFLFHAAFDFRPPEMRRRRRCLILVSFSFFF